MGSIWKSRAERTLHRGVWAANDYRQQLGRTQRTSFKQYLVADHGTAWRYDGDLYVDDLWGYVFDANRVLYEGSLAPNFEYHKKPWRIGLTSPFGNPPSADRREKPVRREREVVSLRHFWEWNYYHFLMDVLPKLKVMDEIGVDPSIPVAVGRYVMEFIWASEIVESGRFQDRNWIVQDRFAIGAETVWGCQSGVSHVDRMKFVRESVGLDGIHPAGEQKMFLIRPKGTSRSAHNLDECIELLSEYGFEPVDSGSLTFEQQVSAFAKTRYMIALHGAGMTNMIFRSGRPMSVLELHGDIYVSRDMKAMCEQSGWYFDRLAGKSDTDKAMQANYVIDLDVLRDRTEALLAN